MSTESAYPFVNTYGSTRLEITKGKGCMLWDSDGKKYLDFFSGIAVNALGYGNKDIAKVIARQYCALPHISNLYTTAPSTKLAEEILSYQPITNRSYEGVFFSNSGAEANEAALKFSAIYAQNVQKRAPFFASFRNSFHGRTFLTLAITSQKKYKGMYEKILPNTRVLSFNNLTSLHQNLDDKVSAVIVEVIQGEGGMNMITDECALLLNRICRSKDIILIADEVQTGLGRTGFMYASEQVGLKPDIITIAKPLGGGLPLAATLVEKKINAHITPATHGSTFGGGPIQCAAAHKVWKHINRYSFLQQVRKISSHLGDSLLKLASNNSCIAELKGAGLLRGMRLKKNIDIPVVISQLKEVGLLTIPSGSNVIRLAPPLVVTKTEISYAINMLNKVLSEY